MNDIKFSIITVSYNREKYIEQTIQSIIAQDYKNYEYIIIDGLSTDGTVSIIEKYQKHITFFKSEKDNSMYDAINKGLHYVTGDFVLILNSDDYLASSTIFTEVASQISLNPGKDAYFGDICIIRNMNKVRKYFQNISYKELLSSRYCRFVPHTALFVSKRVYDQMKGYDLKYKYASDFDFILKIFESFL